MAPFLFAGINMAHIDIIIGSTLGAAEYVAEHLAEQLQAQQHSTELHYQPDLSRLLASRALTAASRRGSVASARARRS